MRLFLAVVALLLASCGGPRPKSTAPAANSTPAPPAPILAPLAARDHLLESLAEQKKQARDRAATCDESAELGR